ncbi:MAG TPA: hypothetical protein VGB85_18140 [Nannocystis sp.]|jgi:hypothetical protein
MICTPTTRLFAVSLALSACNQLEKIDESGNASGGDSIPTDVQLAFERSCGTSPACHAAGGLPPTLEGAGIGALIGAPSSAGIPLITLGDTANSYVAIKMLPDDVLGGLGVMRMGARMPLGFDYATGSEDILADTRTILAWIGGADYPGGGTGETADPTDDGGESSSSGGALEPTFANVESTIYATSCSCHYFAPGGPGNGELGLQMGMSYAATVGVKSKQLATMDLIKAGDPEASYLYLKTINKHLDAGGVGDKMPQGGMLSPEQLMLLEEWITAGALNN